MVRGSGKFKQKRGGGRNFSKNLELDENGTAVSVDKRAKAEDDGDDDEEEEESSEEEEEEEEAPAATAGGQKEELTREQRRAQKKQAKAKPAEGEDGEEGDDPLEVNTNRGGAKTMKLSEVGALAPPSRREKEAKEKKDAQERYWKLHEQGKTDQAKTDMARLAKIRAEREAAAAKRKAEAGEKAAEADAKKKAQMSGKRQ